MFEAISVRSDRVFPEAVIFDVDGTLCDVRSVRQYVEAPPGQVRFKADFRRFHAESIYCPANPAVLELACRAHAAEYSVLVVTGREESWRDLTSRWLKANGVPFEGLYTRGLGGYRPDHVVKAEIEREISERYRARLAVDDRSDTAAVWLAAGIATVLVSPEGKLGNVNWPQDTPADSALLDLVGLRTQS